MVRAKYYGAFENMRIRDGKRIPLLTKRRVICYYIFCKIAYRGCNGLDGGSWCMGSEPGGHHPVSKVKLLLNIKANEDYALAA